MNIITERKVLDLVLGPENAIEFRHDEDNSIVSQNALINDAVLG